MGKSESITSKIDPNVKTVLKLLAAGAILTTVLLVPGLAAAAPLIKEYQRRKEEKNEKEWDKFNLYRLRQIIKRLEKQKIVEFTNDGFIKITNNGKQKMLKYQIEDMNLSFKPDGKWRIIIYDIEEMKRWQRNLFRQMLKKLKFLQLQKSVYLTPFPCENEIEYLRQIFEVGMEVRIITATGLENEEAYKKYFGI